MSGRTDTTSSPSPSSDATGGTHDPRQWILDESKREIFLLTACREHGDNREGSTHSVIGRMDSGSTTDSTKTPPPVPAANAFNSSSETFTSYSAVIGPRQAGMCMTWVTPACLEQNRIVMVLSKHNATTNILLRGFNKSSAAQNLNIGTPPQSPPGAPTPPESPPDADNSAPAQRHGHFVLHLLAVDQVHLVKIFGLQSSRDLDKFVGLDYSTIPVDGDEDAPGIPLLPDTCGWAKGTVMSVMDSGDRYVVLAHVENQHYDSSKTPLRVQDLKSLLDKETVGELDKKFRRDIRRDRRMRSQQQVHWMRQAGKGCETSQNLLGSVKAQKVGVRKGKKNEARTVFFHEQQQHESSLSSTTATSTEESS